MPKYIKQEMSSKLTKDGNPRAYYRMKTTNMSSDQLLNAMSCPGSGISKGEATGFLIALTDTIRRFLADGYSVTLDGLGTFRCSLGVVEGKEMESVEGDENRHNAKSVEVRDVTFSADKEFVRLIDRDTDLTRAGTSRIRKSPYSPEERLQLAIDYLHNHRIMHIADYMQITGLSRTTATLELQRLYQDPSNPISADGRGSQKVYVLKD